MKPRLKATPLLRPLVFGRLAKTIIHFLVKKHSEYGHPVIKAKFFWPIGDRINAVALYSPRPKGYCYPT